MDSLSNIDWGSMAVKAGSGLLILIITFILAKVVKSLVKKLARKIPALQKQGAEGESLGASLGSIASLVIWLFGLIALLGVFRLDNVLKPISGMLDVTLAYLPQVVGAVFVFIVGLMIARIARTVITTALVALNIEKRLTRIQGAAASGTHARDDEVPYGAQATPAPDVQYGSQAAPMPGQQAPGAQGAPVGGPQQQQPTGGSKIAQTVGSVVYGVIVIVVAIAALQILGIKAISEPAEQMLSTVLDALPNIIAAGLILFLGVMIARFVAKLLGDVLRGVGLDSSLRKADVLPEGKSVLPVITNVVLVAIVLFFGVMAAHMLGFPQITELLNTVLGIGGKVVFGALIIVAGFFIATFVAKFLSGAAANIVKYATIVLFAAIGLQAMGLADSIIQIAFGALVIGGAAAGVLAFGLGGRDAAARTLNKLEKRADEGPAHSAQSSPEI